jgi:two-component system KDP operon response regulator KdpE
MATKMFKKNTPDVVVLDLGLPDGDGKQFLIDIRQTHKTPVLILTARDQESEKICLLEAGANDYLSKPFGIKELMMRIKVLVRDLVDKNNSSDILTYKRLKLKKTSHQTWLDGNEIALTKKEFAFVEILLLQPGVLVMQSPLLEQIWGGSHREDKHYLRVLVSQLRKKFNDCSEQPQLIKTEPGLGYRLI